MSLILTKPQAEAVYSAMCALGGVSHAEGFRISFYGTIGGNIERIDVEETDVDMIRVGYHDGRTTHCEHHEGQAAFAAAYGLQTDGQKRRAERRERDEPYLIHGVEETRTGNRA